MREDAEVEKVVWFIYRGSGGGGVHEKRVIAFTSFPFSAADLTRFELKVWSPDGGGPRRFVAARLLDGGLGLGEWKLENTFFSSAFGFG